MKKDLLSISFIWRFAVSLIVCTGLVIFLIWNRILFFGESQATDQYAMLIEPYRPVFYNCMLFLILATYLIGVVMAYRRTVIIKTDADKNVTMPRSVLIVGAAVFVVINACISFGIIELINNPWMMLLKPIYIFLGIGITLVLYLILVLLTNSLTVGMIIGNVQRSGGKLFISVLAVRSRNCSDNLPVYALAVYLELSYFRQSARENRCERRGICSYNAFLYSHFRDRHAGRDRNMAPGLAPAVYV